MDTVMTVTGPISSDDLGFTSIHEHLFCDLSRDTPGRNSMLNEVELTYRELTHYKDAGGVTLVDQTTAGLRGPRPPPPPNETRPRRPPDG